MVAVAIPSHIPITKCIGSMKSRNLPIGRAVIPDIVVSATRAKAPSSMAQTQVKTDIAESFANETGYRIKGLKSNG